MNARSYRILTIFIVSLFSASCATNLEQRKELSSIFPLKKVNLELIIEQQRGLEIEWEDAKDVRDFYRGGVQHKAKAEEKVRTNVYSEALKFYQRNFHKIITDIKFREDFIQNVDISWPIVEK